MSLDKFRHRDREVDDPARASFAVVPHNVNQLAVLPTRIFVGTGGNITMRLVDSTVDVVYKNIANGTYLKVRPQYIRATGTTATDIVGEA